MSDRVLGGICWSGETQAWMQVFRGKHKPRCNERCSGDSHYLLREQQ